MRGVFRHPLAQRIALGAAGLAILSVVAVEPAHSQFGIDIAAILAGRIALLTRMAKTLFIHPR